MSAYFDRPRKKKRKYSLDEIQQQCGTNVKSPPPPPLPQTHQKSLVVVTAGGNNSYLRNISDRLTDLSASSADASLYALCREWINSPSEQEAARPKPSQATTPRCDKGITTPDEAPSGTSSYFITKLPEPSNSEDKSSSLRIVA